MSCTIKLSLSEHKILYVYVCVIITTIKFQSISIFHRKETYSLRIIYYTLLLSPQQTLSFFFISVNLLILETSYELIIQYITIAFGFFHLANWTQYPCCVIYQYIIFCIVKYTPLSGYKQFSLCYDDSSYVILYAFTQFHYF